MEICIVGKSAKITKVIERSEINKRNNIHIHDQRKTSKCYILKEIEAIIYLVSNTSTTPKLQEYGQYIYSNCFLLADFITKNLENIKRKKFIYFSTAKIYNIFPNKNEYNGKESMETISNYSILLKIAKDIINIAKKNKSREESILGIEKRLINKIKELPKIGEYYPIYEYSKAIAEIIIHELLENAYIIRPTYLYGIEENNNIIYSVIKKAFAGEEIELTSNKKDFVSYYKMIKVLEELLNKKNEGIEILNLSSENNISNQELIYFINAICEMSNKKSKIKFISKNSKEYKIESEKINIKDNFNENIRKMIYLYYIKQVQRLKIISEYKGGSYAKAYLVKSDEKEFIIKICIGNGANNGNIKIKNEAIQMDIMKNILEKQGIFCIPEIYNIKAGENFTIIKEEYVKGKSLSDYIYQEDMNGEFIEKKIKELIKLFLPIYIKGNTSKKINMLEQGIIRVKNRLLQVKETKYEPELFENAINFKQININETEYKNPITLLEKIYDKYKEKFNNKLGLCLSGDVILDNTIIKDKGIYIVDVRGEDLFWMNNKPYFDPYYDCGKIQFYFYGWKSIREERFELKTDSYTICDTKNYIKINDERKMFLHKMANISMKEFLKYKNAINLSETDVEFMDKINLYAGIHFLSDTYPRIVGTGDKLKECYAEFLIGIIIINKMYEKIMKEW